MPAKGQRATHCKHGHPLTRDNRLKVMKGGRGGGSCRVCHLLRTREKRGSTKTGASSPYRQNIPERKAAQAAGLKWCPDCEQGKERTEFNKDRGASDGLHAYCRTCMKVRKRDEYRRHIDQRRAYNRRIKFGITEDEFQRLFDQQKGLCAICKKQCQTGRMLAVDHDHETGRIRGLLCSGCNNGLGRFKDSPDLLKAAAAYLA